MTMSDTLNGQCLCGAVTVTAKPGDDGLHACHCAMCRRWTGSAFVGMAIAPGDLTANGPIKTYVSSEWAERSFCDTCGSTLWYRVTLPGHEFNHVAAGLFDDAGGQALTKEVFIDNKPDGYAFAGDHTLVTKDEMLAIFAKIGGKTE